MSTNYKWCTPERFVDLTPRQLHHFLGEVDEAAALTYYRQLASTFQGMRIKELPSADEFLSLALNKPLVSQFDDETDKKLEAYTLSRLHSGGPINGG